MTNTYAILYAPGSPKDREKRLIQKLKTIIDRFGIQDVQIKINPDLPIRRCPQNNRSNLLTLIVGWGLPSLPAWERIVPESDFLESVRQFIAIDLFERSRLDGNSLKAPKMNAGSHLSQNIKRNNRNLFFDGFFLQAKVPYGMRKVQVKNVFQDKEMNNPVFTFEPGDPSEVEIVRMIFELYVSHDYNRTEICALLNAQEIRGPQKNGTWNAGNIKTILKSPFYIGANQYRGFVKYDVFTPIIEKYIFYEAQSKISQTDLSVGNTTRKKAMP